MFVAVLEALQPPWNFSIEILNERKEGTINELFVHLDPYGSSLIDPRQSALQTHVVGFPKFSMSLILRGSYTKYAPTSEAQDGNMPSRPTP
jgi:hypothetical protein